MMNKNPESRQQEAREIFFADQKRFPDIFRHEVYDSWQRSLAGGLEPNTPYKQILSDLQLNKKRMANCHLLEIAVPFMELLFEIVKGSGFVIMLSDQDGYIIKIIGDSEIINTLRRKPSPLVEGACRSEKIFGTNGIGTALITKKPVLLTSYEHFHLENYGTTGVGAPLIAPDGVLLGALSMSGVRNNVHPHTLGLIVAACKAIVEQLTLEQKNEQLSVTKNQLQMIMDTLDYAVLLLNPDLTIVDVNTAAIKTLDCGREEMLNQPISQFIKGVNFFLHSDITDANIPIKSKNKTEPFFVTVRTIFQNDSGSNPKLITFRGQERIHNLINRYIGTNAHFTFDDIIGESETIRCAKSNAMIAATNIANVLLTGESGTGKELFAQSIHNNSPFSNGPFIAVNCGAIPKSLIESELFGYEPGAFTGANRTGNAGKFELANNGTIFLDEIGDMPYDVQGHLLRILQTKEVVRIGGKKSLPLNIRIIAATNIDLEFAIKEKIFRSDIFYRLNVLSFRIPPLIERGDDILVLTNYFINKYQQQGKPPIQGISQQVEEIFRTYHWPGNVRELENTIERACILCTGDTITDDLLPHNLHPDSWDRHYRETKNEIAVNKNQLNLEFAEKRTIEARLRSCNGNIKKTASILGISRRTLYRKLAKYSIDVNNLR
jgi:transcriptional regulator with PAS, ATPase and Fis domain